MSKVFDDFLNIAGTAMSLQDFLQIKMVVEQLNGQFTPDEYSLLSLVFRDVFTYSKINRELYAISPFLKYTSNTVKLSELGTNVSYRVHTNTVLRVEEGSQLFQLSTLEHYIISLHDVYKDLSFSYFTKGDLIQYYEGAPDVQDLFLSNIGKVAIKTQHFSLDVPAYLFLEMESTFVDGAVILSSNDTTSTLTYNTATEILVIENNKKAIQRFSLKQNLLLSFIKMMQLPCTPTEDLEKMKPLILFEYSGILYKFYPNGMISIGGKLFNKLQLSLLYTVVADGMSKYTLDTGEYLYLDTLFNGGIIQVFEYVNTFGDLPNAPDIQYSLDHDTLLVLINHFSLVVSNLKNNKYMVTSKPQYLDSQIVRTSISEFTNQPVMDITSRVEIFK